MRSQHLKTLSGKSLTIAYLKSNVCDSIGQEFSGIKLRVIQQVYLAHTYSTPFICAKIDFSLQLNPSKSL
jgi:hypothetical protein